jgi:hypothetical protein
MIPLHQNFRALATEAYAEAKIRELRSSEEAGVTPVERREQAPGRNSLRPAHTFNLSFARFS